MIQFAGQGILLDIEGTTSSLNFVRDVLFPYARRHLPTALRTHWNDPQMEGIRQGLAALYHRKSFEEWTGGKGMPPEARLKLMSKALVQLMSEDAKVGL
jgi:enolase-phosphatase E1